jgi:hypothetical protein
VTPKIIARTSLREAVKGSKFMDFYLRARDVSQIRSFSETDIVKKGPVHIAQPFG